MGTVGLGLPVKRTKASGSSSARRALQKTRPHGLTDSQLLSFCPCKTSRNHLPNPHFKTADLFPLFFPRVPSLTPSQLNRSRAY